MTTVADYQGRTYDVMAFQGVTPEGNALLSQTLTGAEDGGTIATGVQKLAQRFLIEFLHDVGSVPYSRSRGSSFMPTFRAGAMRTELDVAAAFALAVGEVQTHLASLETAADPDDERFQDAELQHIGITFDRLELHINVTSRAGDARRVILPLNTVVRG